MGVGVPVDAHPAKAPSPSPVDGRAVYLEKLEPRHADDLWEALGPQEYSGIWDYIPDGPFPHKESFVLFIEHISRSADPYLYCLIDKARGKAVGFFSLMRIDQKNRVIEIGYVVFSPLLQRTTAATEAVYLLAKKIFEELDYRRFEWKCNNLNEASKRAALRYGFTFEGVFRQHMIVKGHNRDTAWFSILDSEWPAVRGAFEKWLSPKNFDADGKQIQSLASLRG
ncbi:hypothetical protein N7470_002145 [Penicillium chermesinum]|nr:hypothetical protein N7470_002145 [Penicillium chermesinum]